MIIIYIFEYAVVNGVLECNPIKAVYIPKHERKNGEAFTRTFLWNTNKNKQKN